MDEINEALGYIAELRKTVQEATPIIMAYKYSLESFSNVLEDIRHDIDLLDEDIKSGVRGYGVSKNKIVLETKAKLMSEVICFMTTALEDAKKGDIE